MANVLYCENPYRKTANAEETAAVADRFGTGVAETAHAFHKGFPEYAETPLVRLKERAKDLVLKELYVKDESYRFGLNAFKVLGGSYAIARIVAEWVGQNAAGLTPAETAARLSELTFVTATDGNHGRGVAWAAKRFGAKCVVYMPKGSAAERLENIRALGADATITDLSYDDAVRLAAKNAAENGWILVQDTAWEGYDIIPRWIMEGYTTLAIEAVRQLEREAEENGKADPKAAARPTHVFLQAGVGAMAGAVAGFLTSYYGKDAPRIFVVEPEGADCFFRTAAANDGAIHSYPGEMHTIMAGLACGEPCPLGWEVLRDVAEGFFAIPDEVAEEGMCALANPIYGDSAVVSGESGAATFGLVAELMNNPAHGDLVEAIGLDYDSRVLLISTEGATDQANYNKIVWGLSVE